MNDFYNQLFCTRDEDRRVEEPILVNPYRHIQYFWWKGKKGKNLGESPYSSADEHVLSSNPVFSIRSK